MSRYTKQGACIDGYDPTYAVMLAVIDEVCRLKFATEHTYLAYSEFRSVLARIWIQRTPPQISAKNWTFPQRRMLAQNVGEACGYASIAYLN